MTLAKRTLESTPDSIYQSRVDLAAAHRLANKFGFDDGYEGADNEVGEQFASAMSDKSVLVNRNHGVTVVGATVAEAFYNLYYLELACKRQYLMATSGCKASVVPENISARTRQLIDSEFTTSAVLYFDALKRELDREDPGYIA